VAFSCSSSLPFHLPFLNPKIGMRCRSLHPFDGAKTYYNALSMLILINLLTLLSSLAVILLFSCHICCSCKPDQSMYMRVTMIVCSSPATYAAPANQINPMYMRVMMLGAWGPEQQCTMHHSPNDFWGRMKWSFSSMPAPRRPRFQIL